MKQKIINILYALGLQLILLIFITIMAYTVVNNDFMVNKALGIIYMLIAILLNIGVIYIVNYLVNKFIKMPLIYYIIIGAITLFIIVWLRVYCVTLEQLTCSNISSQGCFDAIKQTKTVTMDLIIGLAYYFIYIVMDKMSSKKQK